MAQKTEGIQQLLIAEKKASEKVGEARKRRVQKLKTAKKEADAEINKYKADKDNQCKKYEEELLGKRSDNEAQIQLQTNQKIKQIEANLKEHKTETVKSLLEVLFDIQVRLHENVKF